MSNETFPFLTPDKLAPLAIGSWVTVVLFGIEGLQAARYFRSKARRRDGAFVKLGVSFNLLADAVGTMACCAATYLYTVIYWGNDEGLAKQYWPLPFVVFTVGAVTAVSQLFMISRHWQTTKQHYVFALLILILAAAVTGIFGIGVLMALKPNATSMLLDTFLYLALFASAVGTVLVSPLLFWQLCRKSTIPITGWNFIPRVVSLLFEAGFLTAAVTVAGVATSFGTLRDERIWIAFAFVQARVYSCTMLFALHTGPESETDGTTAAMALTSNEHLIPPPMIESKSAPATVMEDNDAFRLTRKKIELHGREFDSSSDVSRNLNDELNEIEQDGASRQPSLDGSDGGHLDIPSRSSTPSDYPRSPSPNGHHSPWPLSPRPTSPINRSISYAI
ncbi:hypothetical protein DFH07DRAFT_765982 [Mycena maculata]|uniref:DUF6534 domain-containing protein n=1 Tax=Mycena maculata TaxID=230809 RepID=A0AAD7K5K5_9AGAR|nr:hypothetical protein DFH07DRAFT_765982 [Mycena maculata]